ncbi:hypothetical protein SAMN04487969_1256 [Paenibacillus algorifonticola]|uniref:Uncharacterized protein n=1 Tax=Paenibacillus algorifonticola TaxID=684063 RepID=A0A1I2HMC2_9BACL|nr:hypothetical protein SAMN04487969_1256 [Paenibacillus algorifonticola]
MLKNKQASVMDPMLENKTESPGACFPDFFLKYRKLYDFPILSLYFYAKR